MTCIRNTFWCEVNGTPIPPRPEWYQVGEVTSRSMVQFHLAAVCIYKTKLKQI